MNRYFLLFALPLFVAAVTGLADTTPTTSPAGATEVQPDGSLLLKPAGARIHGHKLHLQPTPEPTIIFWVDPKESIEWPMAITKKGKYDVEITYSCAPRAGGDFVVSAAASKCNAHAENSADWQTFLTKKVGTLNVLNDQTTLSIHSNGYIAHALINVRLVKLTPVTDDKK